MYLERIILAEHGTFDPLEFTTVGRMGQAANIFYQTLASVISESHDQPYSSVFHWIRCRLVFSLIRSSILCLRGARSFLHNPIILDAIELALSSFSDFATEYIWFSFLCIVFIFHYYCMLACILSRACPVCVYVFINMYAYSSPFAFIQSTAQNSFSLVPSRSRRARRTRLETVHTNIPWQPCVYTYLKLNK